MTSLSCQKLFYSQEIIDSFNQYKNIETQLKERDSQVAEMKVN